MLAPLSEPCTLSPHPESTTDWRGALVTGRGMRLFLGGGLGFFLRQTLHVFASTFRHIFPLALIHIHFGLAGTRMTAADTGAIVLTSLGDAEAFFFVLRSGRHSHH